MLKRVLVANRGEIAVRIMRACHEMGIETVAVYSDVDEEALHVRMAGQAVQLGPAPASESYLVQEKILEAATRTGADAIHPGYGFLSENAAFAAAVQKAGLVWIGPPPDAMERMGDKVQARAEAAKAGVPVAPGSEALSDAEEASAKAGKIGFPVMLKASAGGGGIGMRVVHEPEELGPQFESARKQAKAAFGVPDVFMEKFIERPRHIEVQVLADGHGNCIHLFERECSIQRRHQKLVEEAPSPALSQGQREDIGARAVQLAKQVGYENAGTMEFLYEDGHFYFNEMNTRLQVEHPVTELVTSVDLVQWQLRIAGGEELTLHQEDVRLRGHAFEARINAEDPMQDFAPCPGPVHRLRLPHGPGIRVDAGLYEGWTVPSNYDSMVLKLITHSSDRQENCRRMRRALGELEIGGFATNAVFHEALFAHDRFVAGDISTRFLEEESIMSGPTSLEVDGMRAAAVLAALGDAPGGGLAGIQLRQSMPRRIHSSTGRRDWRMA